MDPFEEAAVINDPQYSEIVPDNAPGATQEGAGQAPATREANNPLSHTLVTDLPMPGDGQAEGEGDGDVIPDWINAIPESTLPTPEGEPGDELVLDEVTAEDEAFIQAAKTPEEFKERTQQIKKRIHDVNSARIGNYKAQMRAKDAENQALQRLIASGKLPPGVVDMQQGQARESRVVDTFNAPATDDPTQLPEYQARARAKAYRYRQYYEA